MGKFLGKLVLIGAAIAVNVIPGAGQVISGAISAGLAAAGGTAFALSTTALTIAGAVGTGLTLGITAAGIQSLAGVLGLGPSAPKPDTTETAVRTARPVRISAYGASRLYGAYILYETAENGTAVDVFAVHDGLMDGLLQLYLGDDKVTLTGSFVNEGDDKRYQDNAVNMHYTNGANPGSAISALVSLLPGIWTTNHRGDGVVILAVTAKAVKAKKFSDTYPARGVPVGSMAAKWQRCPDPYAADPSLESGWTWTENPIRQLMHYMLVREQVDYATKIAPTLDYWKTASTICDEAVPLKAGGTEPRWRSCVSHKHNDTHASVKSALMKCCDGWFGVNSDGSYMVYAGKYYTPTVEIGPDQIIAFEWAGVGRDDDDSVNEINCSYVSAEHDYNSVETDSWRNEDDIAERGQILSDMLDPQVPSHGQVRRLAKRQMARINAIHRGTVSTNPEGRIVRGERYINLRLVEAGTTFYDGPVEVTEVTRNIMTGGVTFSWVAIDPNVDAWNPATEEGDPAPVGNRVAPAPLDTPTISAAAAVLSSDGANAQVEIDVNASDRDDLTWYGRWKLSSDTVWNEQEYSDIDASSVVTLLIGLVPLNASVDVAAAYSTGDGRVSDWSATSTVSTSTAGLAPGPVTDVSASGGVGEITVNWRNPGATNYSYTRNYYGTTNVFSAATAFTPDDVAGALAVRSETYGGIAAGTYYVWSRSFSGTGAGSNPVLATGTVTVT